jgi:hypothetical protein
VTCLHPWAVGAFNDCSIRREGAAKISHKKNWGPHSKGVARRFFPVADLEPTGALGTLRLASFLRRDGVVHEYGVDSPASGYSYAGTVLLDWVVERLRNQEDAPGTPLEHVGAYLRDAGRPATVLVGIGATRYTPFGEGTYLRAGDDAVVVVYDTRVVGPAEVRAAVETGAERGLPGASVLCQRVEAEEA